MAVRLWGWEAASLWGLSLNWLSMVRLILDLVPQWCQHWPTHKWCCGACRHRRTFGIFPHHLPSSWPLPSLKGTTSSTWIYLASNGQDHRNLHHLSDKIPALPSKLQISCASYWLAWFLRIGSPWIFSKSVEQSNWDMVVHTLKYIIWLLVI